MSMEPGRTIRIGRTLIGAGQPTFVIAEVGCNHENQFDRACEMVAKAAEAGANAVKFQSFDSDTLVTRDAPKFWDIEGPGRTQHEEFVAIQPRFSRAEYERLIALADRLGIIWFSTPTNVALTDFLDQLGVPLFKVASMDLTYTDLIRHIARKRKPVILSTGASGVEEVRQAVHAIREEGNDDIVLLHCISAYPTLPSQANLRMMHHLVREFPECVVGYSDHTRPDSALLVPTLAVASGAQVIEKHFTFDTTRPGYDHEISADYSGLKRMVEQFRFVEQVLGVGTKTPTQVEAGARQFGRRSLVAAVPIPQGTCLQRAMVAVKRPGTGIAPAEIDDVVGKIAARDIAQDEVLTWTALGQR